MIFSKPSPCPILTRCSLRLLSIQAWQKVEAKLIRTMASHVSNLFQRTRKTRPAGELISIGLIYVIFDFYISHTVSFCFLQVVVSAPQWMPTFYARKGHDKMNVLKNIVFLKCQDLIIWDLSFTYHLYMHASFQHQDALSQVTYLA